MKGCPLRHGSALVLLTVVTATAQEQTAGVAPAPVSQLEAAVRRDPKSPSAHIALGLAYWGRNEYPRALQAFRRAVEVTGPLRIVKDAAHSSAHEIVVAMEQIGAK